MSGMYELVRRKRIRLALFFSIVLLAITTTKVTIGLDKKKPSDTNPATACESLFGTDHDIEPMKKCVSLVEFYNTMETTYWYVMIARRTTRLLGVFITVVFLALACVVDVKAMKRIRDIYQSGAARQIPIMGKAAPTVKTPIRFLIITAWIAPFICVILSWQVPLGPSYSHNLEILSVKIEELIQSVLLYYSAAPLDDNSLGIVADVVPTIVRIMMLLADIPMVVVTVFPQAIGLIAGCAKGINIFVKLNEPDDDDMSIEINSLAGGEDQQGAVVGEAKLEPSIVRLLNTVAAGMFCLQVPIFAGVCTLISVFGGDWWIWASMICAIVCFVTSCLINVRNSIGGATHGSSRLVTILYAMFIILTLGLGVVGVLTLGKENKILAEFIDLEKLFKPLNLSRMVVRFCVQYFLSSVATTELITAVVRPRM